MSWPPSKARINSVVAPPSGVASHRNSTHLRFCLTISLFFSIDRSQVLGRFFCADFVKWINRFAVLFAVVRRLHARYDRLWGVFVISSGNIRTHARLCPFDDLRPCSKREPKALRDVAKNRLLALTCVRVESRDRINCTPRTFESFHFGCSLCVRNCSTNRFLGMHAIASNDRTPAVIVCRLITQLFWLMFAVDCGATVLPRDAAFRGRVDRLAAKRRRTFEFVNPPHTNRAEIVLTSIRWRSNVEAEAWITDECIAWHGARRGQSPQCLWFAVSFAIGGKTNNFQMFCDLCDR